MPHLLSFPRLWPFLTTLSSVVFSLEDAMLKALPTLFPNLLGKASNPRVEFYEKFERAADDRDRDFIKKYDEDLNTTLIFVSIFSTSTSVSRESEGNRPVYSPRSHPLLSSTFRRSSNRIMKK
jgi:hypothetical protein